MKIKTINYSGHDHLLIPVKEKDLLIEALDLLKDETAGDLAYSQQRAKESYKAHYAQDVIDRTKQLKKIKTLLKNLSKKD